MKRAEWILPLCVFLAFASALILPPAANAEKLPCLDGTPAAEIPASLHSVLFTGTSSLRESGKIRYLLHEIEESPFLFIRNGMRYEGSEASRHLKWKYGFARGRIATAREFLDHIADRSMKSGEPYRVEISGRQYRLKDILQQELLLLEDHIEESAEAGTPSG